LKRGRQSCVGDFAKGIDPTGVNAMEHKPKDLGKAEDESFVTTALWAGGALAIVAGIAVYAGMQG
jgi:hypothetical protein